MALTINGFGTRYYGKKWQDDGTYITTKYIVFLWVPVIKIGEQRVRPIIPRELQKGPRAAWINVRDLAYVLAAMALLFLGLPALINWLR